MPGYLSDLRKGAARSALQKHDMPLDPMRSATPPVEDRARVADILNRLPDGWNDASPEYQALDAEERRIIAGRRPSLPGERHNTPPPNLVSEPTLEPIRSPPNTPQRAAPQRAQTVEAQPARRARPQPPRSSVGTWNKVEE